MGKGESQTTAGRPRTQPHPLSQRATLFCPALSSALSPTVSRDESAELASTLEILSAPRLPTPPASPPAPLPPAPVLLMLCH